MRYIIYTNFMFWLISLAAVLIYIIRSCSSVCNDSKISTG